MKKNLAFGLIILINLTLTYFAYAQTSGGGTPISYSNSNIKSLSKLPIVTMPSFNVDSMLKEDILDQYKSKPLRFAKGFDVNYTLSNSGLWENLENGDKIWRLVIQSPKAYTINIIFNEFHIPNGAKVYIFNIDTTNCIGPFTSKNNHVSNILPTIPVQGDKIVVEYYEPANVTFKGQLVIGKISHDYTGITISCGSTPQGGSCYGQSLSCEVNPICVAPNWQNEKHAVVRLFINGNTLCSGALLNNTAENGTPYVLTANHCICNSSLASSTVAVFNYESPSCNGSDGPLSQYIQTATLISNWPNSDFSLIQLSSTPPQSYIPYYLGWDNTGVTPPTPVTCIHHPKGDVKKITSSTNSVSSNEVNFNDGSTCQTYQGNIDTWYESGWTTGATEAGSSGSPLIDNNHRVVVTARPTPYLTS